MTNNEDDKSVHSLQEWDTLNAAVTACRRCPRLVEHCQLVAREKRKAFQEWSYWGAPVPNFGNTPARLLIVGLAPAAHGANRTGRMFTGDRSGEWLYRALWKAGFASQAESTHVGDGLTLVDCAITAICHCAPPDNRPTPAEIDSCSRWLDKTIDFVKPKVYVALGQIAWNGLWKALRQTGAQNGPKPKFFHGTTVCAADGSTVIGSYHPSQQNTFTGRLTEPMFDQVFTTARAKLEALSRPTR